jgi:hypothetical protein
MRLGGPGQDMATSVVESSDGSYVVAGITGSYGAGAEDAWMAKVKLENTTSTSENAAGNLTSENTSKSNVAPKNIPSMPVKDLLMVHP